MSTIKHPIGSDGAAARKAGAEPKLFDYISLRLEEK